MIKDLTDIIEKVKDRITDASDIVWTRYNTAKELRDELELYIEDLNNGNYGCIEKLNMHFLPTGTFQEHSIYNGWDDEYMRLSVKFDNIYASMKNRNK